MDLERIEIRNKIIAFEGHIKTLPGALITQEEIDTVNPLKHSFGEGCYVREMNSPADELIVTKIHKKAHPFFLLEGEISILTERGYQRIKAPFYMVTPAGTKRIIRTHSPIKLVTIHVTDKTDLDEIENEIIAKDFSEFDNIIEIGEI